jgi:hypothetical protein
MTITVASTDGVLAGAGALIPKLTTGARPATGPATAAGYDHAMRQRAADARDVLPRSGFVAPCGVPQHLVFTAPDGRVEVADLAEGDAVTVPRSARVLIGLVEAEVPVEGKLDVSRPLPVLFADELTVRRVIAGFRRAADRGEAERRRYIAAANRLTLVSSMKFSVLRPVLTRLLGHRFWIDTRSNQHLWQEWAAAWSGTAKVARVAGQLELLHALTGLAFAHGGTRPLPDTLRTTLAIKEAMAWDRGASSKPTSTHSAYRAVTDFEAAWSEFSLADPLLHDRNALSGDVAVGSVTQTLGRTMVLLDNTPRFNDAGLWAVIDGHRFKVTRESMLAGEDNSLTMVLAVPPGSQGAFTAARDGRLTVTLYPQRFTMPAATPRADNPWLNAPDKPWTRREVPADVLLAGAPTD